MAVIDIARLNRHEKLELIEEIWKSLSHEADTIPLTTAQRAELDRRLDEVETVRVASPGTRCSDASGQKPE